MNNLMKSGHDLVVAMGNRDRRAEAKALASFMDAALSPDAAPSRPIDDIRSELLDLSYYWRAGDAPFGGVGDRGCYEIHIGPPELASWIDGEIAADLGEWAGCEIKLCPISGYNTHDRSVMATLKSYRVADGKLMATYRVDEPE